MELPDNLKIFEKEARLYLERRLVQEIEFSGSTYQVLVKIGKDNHPLWTFLQLDKNNQLTDFFCEEEEFEEEPIPCAHICAAFLKIFNGHDAPLHERFQRSLWHALSKLFFEKSGEHPLFKRRDKGHYFLDSQSGKILVEIKAKSNSSINFLIEAIENHHQATEENSLKFSNLSQEELRLWREGRPSSKLLYELSFWSDFAKFLMLRQEENEPYGISYGFSNTGLPNEIVIHFESIMASFYISEANLPLIIPSLVNVKSPLKVYDAPEEEIKKIIYDKKKGCLLVEPAHLIEKSPLEEQRHHREKDGIAIANWIFVPLEGFYARNPHWLLSQRIICDREISKVLNDYSSLVCELLEGSIFHQESVKISYSIAFDREWNLLITGYLFSPGDLSTGDSKYLGDYAYLDDDGFYKLEGVLFPELETIVNPDQLPDFISKNKVWLNTQEGFHIHPASVEAKLLYEVDKEGKLNFFSKLDTRDNNEENKDFGPWAYLAGQGFYSKESSYAGLQVRAGASINQTQIPLFIKVHRDELSLVPNFFSKKSPIKRVLLDVYNKAKNIISLSPHYVLYEGYQQGQVLFFDDFSYVEGEGFHEIPLGARLPEAYMHAMDISPENLEFFLTQELPTLEPYIHSIDVKLSRPKSMALISTELHKDKPLGTNLEYTAKLKYKTEWGSVPVTDIWKNIRKKKKFFFSPAGLLDLQDRRYDWIRWLHKGQVDQQEHAIKLSTIELMRINALEEIICKESKNLEPNPCQDLLRELVELKPPEDPNLTGLVSTLRPYQQLGVQWLWFLYHYNLSGLLCDDMGLGKTHQTMALIAAIFNRKKEQGDNSPSFILIVCPTSVIYHWQEKLMAYLPHLRVHVFYGQARSLKEFDGNYDILLTSYGICRIESLHLRHIPFELAVFDEIQLAKNHNTRLYSILLALNAKIRIGLTGTPIENHLRELKALFDIVLPLYMPSEADFRDFFVRPIEKENSQERKNLLRRVIKPFVLRRRKEDVLVDLPDKTEEISHCDFTPEQGRLYNEVIRAGRARILNELQDESAAVPFIHIFALLSALKQICDHPAVYLKQPEEYKNYTSGKWDLFVELLNEARESRQKVVIFSQYLRMLDIFENYLTEMGIGYAGIRGATANRGEQLRRFQEDPTCEVFLASLQAAGLGIDLTAASVVIHYDRWWNAARENQATDRVHRIGQHRGVQVFKLVTKDSFEERIDELIRKKGELMNEVVSVDDHEIIKSFTREELIEFLQETKTWRE